MSGTNITDGMWDLYEHGWVDFLEKHRDPRVKDWLFLNSPVPLLIILGSYLFFSLSLGPKLMAKRRPFKIKGYLLLYNFINVVINIYLCMESWHIGCFTHHSFSCEPVDYSNSPSAMREARAGHSYFLTKIVDLLDTVFFIVRKKDNQVTGLHLYHHTVMPLLAWTTANFVAGGHYVFGAAINSFVHLIMYSYYFLSALVPPKYLWWKKYITTLQLVQFVIVIFHETRMLFNVCDISKFVAVLTISQGVIFFYMFYKFYVKSYSSKKTA